MGRPRGIRFGKKTRIKVYSGAFEFRFENPKAHQPSEWRRQIENFKAHTHDFSDLFDAFGRYMLRAIETAHQEEGRGESWAELAPSTVEERLRLGYGAGPILDRTGTMRNSYDFTGKPQTLQIYNSQAYWIYHQHGTSKMPQRITIQLLQQDKDKFEELLADYIEDSLDT